jgi:hypothetical protein
LDTAKNNGISKSRISLGLKPGDSVNEIRAGVAKKEEVQPATGSKQEDIANNIIVEAGLQWNLPVPINGSNSYFAGPNGCVATLSLIISGALDKPNRPKTHVYFSGQPVCYRYSF